MGSNDRVELQVHDGVAFVDQAAPLTRLHYFDGKFLRADAFATEQDYHRLRVHLANQAGGWGVVHGLGVTLRGAELELSPGLAITPAGRFVLATTALRAGIAELVRRQQAQPLVAQPPGGAGAGFGECQPGSGGGNGNGNSVNETPAQAIYEITVGPVEALCGQEAVYGKLCETACASEARHPYWREGLVLRLRRLNLLLPDGSPLAIASQHLRNRVASAYFAAEQARQATQLSAAGLAGGVWCAPAGLDSREEIVIGLLVREGMATHVLDAWAGRRERMETQARGHWQGVMAMRPWNVFLAQILQFQCQLAESLAPGGGAFVPPDDCEAVRALLARTRREIEGLSARWRQSAEGIVDRVGGPTVRQARTLGVGLRNSFAELDGLAAQLGTVPTGGGAMPPQRMLIQAGFLELPPAGYLPVNPGAGALTEQLQRLFGEGVSLQLHALEEDEIGHLVEQAQHLRRISLTRGLADPRQREPVEVFVPGGRAVDAAARAPGIWWQVAMGEAAAGLVNLFGGGAGEGDGDGNGDGEGFDPATAPTLPGLARTWHGEQGQARLALVMAPDDAGSTGASGSPNTAARQTRWWLEGEVATDPFTLPIGGHTLIGGELRMALRVDLRGQVRTAVLTATAQGSATLLSRQQMAAGALRLTVQVDVSTTLEIQLDGQHAPPQHDRQRHRLVLERSGDGEAGMLLVDTDPLDLRDGALQIQWRDEPRAAVLELVAEVAYRIVADGLEGMSELQRATAAPATAGAASTPATAGAASPQATAAGTVRGATTAATAGSAGGSTSGATARLASLGETANFELSPEALTLRLDAARRILHLRPETRAAGRGATATPATPATAPAATASTASTPRPAATAGLSAMQATQPVRQQRVQLAQAFGLQGIPAATGLLGIAALDAIAVIAEASDDAGFQARARHQLFPTLGSTGATTVEARLDWVAFRRARTPLCGPPCVRGEAGPVVDTKQVWHLRLPTGEEGAIEPEALARALDTGDAAVLGRLRFERVGILRYRDANSEPEEPPARVVAMWQAVQPLEQVLLARVWENAPETGQGWQNHFRLRNLLATIEGLTQPPPRGDGSVRVMRPPPAPLADNVLDGGLLVVTTGRPTEPPAPPPPVQSTLHSVLVTQNRQVFDSFNRQMPNNPASAWEELSAAVANQQVRFHALRFEGGALGAEAMEQLAAIDNEIRSGSSGWQVRGVRLDATPAMPAAAAAAQHTAVLGRLGPTGSQSDLGVAEVPTADVGGGAQVASLVLYLRT